LSQRRPDARDHPEVVDAVAIAGREGLEAGVRALLPAAAGTAWGRRPARSQWMRSQRPAQRDSLRVLVAASGAALLWRAPASAAAFCCCCSSAAGCERMELSVAATGC